MFYKENHIVRSTFLDSAGVPHGFATREGGVTTIPAAGSMNLAPLLGDTEENVRENIARFAKYSGLSGRHVIYGRQIHSDVIMDVSSDTPYGGTCGRECDGYITCDAGVALMVRCADCVPILLAATLDSGAVAVAAVHAGWRGTVAGIAGAAATRLRSLGARPEDIRAAIGPSIADCCFEVQSDFIDAVTEVRGSGFASRHVSRRDGRYFASLRRMNLEILADAGVSGDTVDVSPDCTAHMNNMYHSHRASGGVRGVGGAMIGTPAAEEEDLHD